jgi:hypothetical protein
MSQPPPRTQGAKAEAPESQPPPETETPTMARFEALTRRLLKVPPDELREAECVFSSRKGP